MSVEERGWAGGVIEKENRRGPAAKTDSEQLLDQHHRGAARPALPPSPSAAAVAAALESAVCPESSRMADSKSNQVK